MPLLQIPLLIVAILAVRRLVLEPASEARAASLRQGGAAWFTDLTAKDASRVLPLAAVVMTAVEWTALRAARAAPAGVRRGSEARARRAPPRRGLTGPPRALTASKLTT